MLPPAPTHTIQTHKMGQKQLELQEATVKWKAWTCVHTIQGQKLERVEEKAHSSILGVPCKKKKSNLELSVKICLLIMKNC